MGRIQTKFGIAAAFSAAIVLLGSGAASAGPISGCTLNADDETQTCDFTEIGANGAPTEFLQAETLFLTGGIGDWTSGFEEILDPNGSLSDLVVFLDGTGTAGTSANPNDYANLADLYSCDPTGCAYTPAELVADGYTDLGSVYENSNGFATFSETFTGTDCCDTIKVFSNVPEPLTLSLFGAGLVGIVEARRRRRGAHGKSSRSETVGGSA